MPIVIPSDTRFGRLVVIEETDPIIATYPGHPNHRTRCFRCSCDCGNETVVRMMYLRSGHTSSCGCISKDQTKQRNHRHGASLRGARLPEYRAWEAMKRRCDNPKVERYKSYGGRGITYSDRWRSFENFFADMGKRPSRRHSLDRFPNTDGNYELSNCRWATPEEQANNQTRNVRYTIAGRSQTLAQWVSERSLKYGTVYTRLLAGQSIEAALGIIPYEGKP